jgi:sec-independent protein translocase protein TatB
MFDIGFSELILLAVVALLVVGPKRLPVATRTIGTLLGRAQRYVNDVKSDIQRQVDLEELRKVQRDIQNVGESLQSSVQNVEQEVAGVTQTVAGALDDPFDQIGQSLNLGEPARRGTHISLPEPSWTEQMHQRRVRDRVRNRLRKRFHQKRPRDE